MFGNRILRTIWKRAGKYLPLQILGFGSFSNFLKKKTQQKTILRKKARAFPLFSQRFVKEFGARLATRASSYSVCVWVRGESNPYIILFDIPELDPCFGPHAHMQIAWLGGSPTLVGSSAYAHARMHGWVWWGMSVKEWCVARCFHDKLLYFVFSYFSVLYLVTKC